MSIFDYFLPPGSEMMERHKKVGYCINLHISFRISISIKSMSYETTKFSITRGEYIELTCIIN